MTGDSLTIKTVPTAEMLTQGDFRVYDRNPDGRLDLGDFSADGRPDDGRLDGFVLRYVSTGDREVRTEFLSNMQSSLREEMRKRISDVHKRGIADPALKERVQYILEREFPSRRVVFDLETEYQHRQERARVDQYSLDKKGDSGYAKGTLTFNRPMSRWLFAGKFAFAGILKRREDMESSGGRRSGADTTFYGSQASLDAEMNRRDELALFKVGGHYGRMFNSPPDDVQTSMGGSVAGELNNVKMRRSLFSLRLNASYSKDDFTEPPIESKFYRRSARSASGGAEVALGLSRFGLAMNYKYTDEDSSGHYGANKSASHAAILKGQYTPSGNGSYAGIDISYSRNASRSEDFRYADPIIGTSDNIRGRLHGRMRLGAFELAGAAAAGGVKSEGTFNGWYPKWEGELSLAYLGPRWNVALKGEYSGHRIALDEYQERHAMNLSAKVMFTPADWLKIQMAAGGMYTLIGGLGALDSLAGEIEGRITLSPPAWKRLTLSAYAMAGSSSSSGAGESTFTGAWGSGTEVGIKF